MTKHVIRTALGWSLGLLLLVSCEKETPEETHTTAPTVTFAGVVDAGEHKLKVGESVTLTAIVENAVNPIFSWKIDGKIISTERSLSFVAEKLGEYFANFRVDAENGTAEGQVKISVLEKLPPQITLPAAAVAFIGVDKVFTAEADNAENATYVWRLNGEIVSTTDVYTFNETDMGDYLLSLKVITDDGQDLKTITITVLPEQQPTLFFDNGRYYSSANAGERRKMTVPIGKSLALAPVILNISNPTTFEWKVEGTVQAETGAYFTFTPQEQKAYRITVTEQSTNATGEVEVTCTPPEGTHKRTGGANKYATDAFYYMPAPGQFVNSISATTPTAALNALQSWCGVSGSYFHIGAFGGYFIVGFDHSVENKAGFPDLGIAGNPFASWCESGVVWVMQDENGNGLPDDTWYELRGSETGKPETTQRYALTYYKPASTDNYPLWTDNMGRTGAVNTGYPKFITETWYTLVGTCLNSTFGIDAGRETSKCYDWGYVDGINNAADRPSGQFWIEDAIHVDGSSANLQYIDFVKVHTAINSQGSIVGEISTEAYIPTDLNFQ
ncbi:MAG: hypothetical protein LBF19_03980 [Prevotellaceae bacterium]|jgi:hypothetical protein|nr:hypothetical protein [Prevotellaceae bacterium]